jgi:uncharacterized glyoxalase superfamily protein PhnB
MSQSAPMLQYPDPPAAIEMLSDVLGLTEVAASRIEEGGAIVHAELRSGDARVFVAAVWPEGGFVAPSAQAASSLVWFQLPDVAAARERALAWGGDVSEIQGGPTGALFRWSDPQGQRWLVAAE